MSLITTNQLSTQYVSPTSRKSHLSSTDSYIGDWCNWENQSHFQHYCSGFMLLYLSQVSSVISSSHLLTFKFPMYTSRFFFFPFDSLLHFWNINLKYCTQITWHCQLLFAPQESYLVRTFATLDFTVHLLEVISLIIL